MITKIDVYWQAPKEHQKQRFKIAELARINNQYQFKYIDDLSQVQNKGFNPLFEFSDLNTTYKSPYLFSTFATRLPDEKRIDIDDILRKYGMWQYDAFELLAKSGGRTPGDTLEFVPSFCAEYASDVRDFDFYIAGVNHGEYCDGIDKTICQIDNGVQLNYKLEPFYDIYQQLIYY